jgi:hypothetical protein
MASEHEKLVEGVTNELSGYGVGEDAARAAIAFIAEQTKEVTLRMRVAWQSYDPDDASATGDWSAMHAASALWPSHRDGRERDGAVNEREAD